MNRPLAILTAFYIAGILLGELTNFALSFTLALAGFCFLMAMIGYLLAWRKNRRVLLILFLLLGLAMSRLAIEESETALVKYAGQQVTLIGQVVAEPDVREDKVYYLLKAQEIIRGGERFLIEGDVRLQVKEATMVYSYGDILRVSALLARPDLPGNPGAFNYRTYLERQGIRVTLLARGDKAVEKLADNQSNPVLKTALQLKQKLSSTATSSLTPAQAAVLNGIIFGTQGLIDRETRQAFTETGIVHILSVSGLHIGLALGGVVGLLRLLRFAPSFTAPIATPVLIFYVMMTGFNPAVLRAAIMALFLLWGHHLGRNRDWPTTMALAALFILLWNPLQLFHPGFQLSFAATWGILYLGPLLTGACNKLLVSMPDRWSSSISLALAVPLAAQLATVPLVVWYYNMVSPVSIFANLVAVPLVGLIMLLGILAAAAGLLWFPLAGLINVSNGLSIDLFMKVVSFFQGIPGAVFYVPTPSLILGALWYGCLIIAGCFIAGGYHSALKKRFKIGWIAVGVAFSVTLLLIWMPWEGRDKLVIHFLDTGQGDSILIQTPGGRNMLIDAGGWRDEYRTGNGTGEQVVTPYLRRIGVKRLDVLALTHPHEDHCGGAAAVVKNFPVRLALVPQVDEQIFDGNIADVDVEITDANKGENSSGEEIPPAYKALLNQMNSSGTAVRTAGAGDTLKFDRKVAIEVLSPPEITGDLNSSLNNRSLVLKLTYRHKSFIFTGDVEIEAQSSLLQRETDLKANILKVPHHGSRLLLPEFVAQVKPEIAVITVGAHNTFGHPAQNTLDILYHNGANVFRTDQDGAVIIKTDGYSLEVETGRPESSATATFNRYRSLTSIAPAYVTM
ncbi:MAG: DNA internalization-related competence protein ComEC/Rec2 [Desulfotomaculaceae bacterium]|nr:DNA internalization-related competence protein ComEC/Rec2 [Desulfotomaculaceae bacterium]